MTEPIKKVEGWEFEFCERFSDELDAINYFAIKSFIQNLLAQQAAETRLATIEECAETFRKETEGVCHAACNKPLYLGSIYAKLKSLKEQTN